MRGLAAATGGECELVSPREGMADRVVRHFERMRAPRATRVAVHWPDGATNISPSRIGAVFEGDTVVACASFDRPQAGGSAVLEVETDKGEIVRQELGIPAAPPASSPDGLSTVARVAAAARLKEADDVIGLQTALRYGLISPWTNWLVVAPRAEEEKALDIPALRKVPQTLAAGWGGVGGVAARFSMDPLPASTPRYAASMRLAETVDFDELFLDEPARRIPPLDFPEPYRRLLGLISADASRLEIDGVLDLLTQSGVAAEFDDLFRHAANLGVNVNVVAVIVLVRLLGGPLGELVSGKAQAAMTSLHECAREATEAMREMGRHGVALVRLTQDPLAREVLPKPSGDDTLERLAQVRALLDHLEDAIRTSQQRLHL